MPRANLNKILQAEIDRIDGAHISKRQERVIEGFTNDTPPKAIIGDQEVMVFNSNDYLGLRHHPELKKAEHEASQKYGTGPGAVRFISGSLRVHRDLEEKIAEFHGREDAMIFSSAFAANMAVLFCFIRGQSKDSVVSGNTLVISDELNHRSIIDGIRVAGLPSENKAVFEHMNPSSLQSVLEQHKGAFDRVVVVTDGIFSMLGEYQRLGELRKVIDRYDAEFAEGVVLIVDDCHGVGSFGTTGRGVEEVEGVQADLLVGTMGKAFGADGGYVTGSRLFIEYLRESAATYIYSNNIAPGTAGAAKRALELIDEPEGKALLTNLKSMIERFQTGITELGYTLAAPSIHPIQPILIGDPEKTMALTQALFERGVLVTNINYPVVPRGKDEIRVQISAAHNADSIDAFMVAAKEAGKEVGVLK